MEGKEVSFSLLSFSLLYPRTLAYVPLHEMKYYDGKDGNKPIVSSADEARFFVAQREMRAGLSIRHEMKKSLAALQTSRDFKQIEGMYYSLKSMINSWTAPWSTQLSNYTSSFLPNKLKRELALIEPAASLHQIQVDDYAISPPLSEDKQAALQNRFPEQDLLFQNSNRLPQKTVTRIRSLI